MHEPSDFNRHLTADGRRDIHAVGRAIRRLKIRPDILVSSPLTRAMQTANIVSEYVGVEVQEWDSLRPESNPADAISTMKDSNTNSIMLVGHEPHLSKVISCLISAGQATIILKKSGLACVRLSAQGPAVLRYLLTPRQMRMMS